ncbi:MAG: serine protease [Planctomycetota bacterium]
MNRISISSIVTSVLLLLAAIAFSAQNHQSDEADEAVNHFEVAAKTSMRLIAGGESSTCFLVERLKNDSPQTILVTAAHAITGCTDSHATLIFRNEDERSEIQIPLVDDSGSARWKKHESLDIAVLPVDIPRSPSVNVLNADQLAGHDMFADGAINAGAENLIPCFPVGTESVSPGYPVLRTGTIASYPISSTDQQTFMIDVTAFGGDSGAPVLMPDASGQLILVGMVFAKQQQTDRTVSPYEEIVRHTPMGISLAVKSAFIREMIEQLE